MSRSCQTESGLLHIPSAASLFLNLADTGFNLENFLSGFVVFYINRILSIFQALRAAAPEYQIRVSIEIKQACLTGCIKFLSHIHHMISWVIIGRSHSGHISLLGKILIRINADRCAVIRHGIIEPSPWQQLGQLHLCHSIGFICCS